MTAPPGFAATIFDMDGLLVDSEPLWHEAEVDVLGRLGVPLRRGDTRRTKGMYVGEVTRYWFQRFPWDGPDPDEVAAQVVDAVGALVVERGTLKPGARHALGACRDRGLPLALASSTQYRLISVVLEHFGLAGEFRVVHSAEDEPYGKPHPGVFLTAAEELGVPADGCLVWEDAPAGVLAAKAARMACVAVPDPAERAHRAIGLADAVLDSLEQVDDALLDALAALHDADPMAAPGAHGAPPGQAPGSASGFSK